MDPSSRPAISVIVPVFRERDHLPSCLDCLLPQAAATGSEVLVVDGGSDDGTRSLAESYRRSGVTVLDARRGRGAQMNAGARAAAGELLFFLPADTRVPPGALEILRRISRAGHPAAGGFRQRFDAPRRFLALVSRLHNLRARLTGVFYGDQGPFVRRELFLELGGFREGIDMEDVEFGTRLRRRIRPHALSACLTTSARRFDRVGDLRATATAAYLLFVRSVFRRTPASKTFFSPLR